MAPAWLDSAQQAQWRKDMAALTSGSTSTVIIQHVTGTTYADGVDTPTYASDDTASCLWRDVDHEGEKSRDVRRVLVLVADSDLDAAPNPKDAMLLDNDTFEITEVRTDELGDRYILSGEAAA